jgi:hypothetical protein
MMPIKLISKRFNHSHDIGLISHGANKDNFEEFTVLLLEGVLL